MENAVKRGNIYLFLETSCVGQLVYIMFQKANKYLVWD